MKFLGIRNGHDQNVSYSDGTTVRYIKFERNYQIKHYNWMHNIEDDLSDILNNTVKILNIDLTDLDGICFSSGCIHHRLDKNLDISELFMEINPNNPIWNQFSCPVYSIDHHYAHALSTWPLINIDKVKTHFVLDGLGEHGRVSSIFTNNRLVEYIDRTENMGLSVTLEKVGEQYGIKGMVLDIAGKLMALKAIHEYPKILEEHLMKKVEPLRYRHLNQFIDLVKNTFGHINPPLDEKQKLLAIAHLIHVFGEHKMADYFSLYAGNDEVITYSGGTAQNTIVNTRLKERFPNIHIAPHCPDDGISLGCIEFLREKFQQEYFSNNNFPFWQSDVAPTSTPTSATIDKAAELLAKGKIVGWYQGNGEIGPRALGNRSILMDPSIKGGKDIINSRVKKREPYRPFGASVLLEHTNEIFDCDYESPYMLYVIKCNKEKEFSSIIHLDGTCRIQTVNQDPQYAIYRDLISKFNDKTGIPMLLNTSLNVDGKPIAAYPQDAVTLYDNSDLDAVVIGNEILVK